ncbi:cysteine dioxygenase family protein [Paraburkholderia ginsengisoli]|uniref:Cysteine dioxygenase family protein n=1 Tax=Paraburkholderia ginsengisoli TaxID=311231 RepID=A0A7T4N489_9BURK|nr:cysteine dioxygenase family protein [Paraburkholderia ginsengisoli]QQC64979.1 cysteine dioxygenase family protein [Paraburkholderia ginsengisoli]
MSHNLRATSSDRSCDMLPPLPSLPQTARTPSQAPTETSSLDILRAPLARLCETLDAIFEACVRFPEPSDSTFFARGMRLALAEAASDPALLTPAQREGSTDTYRRHLLAADPHGRYAIAALVWQPRQASPVHAHHTWCGYAVLEGTLSETIFEWDGARHCASAARVQARKPRAVSFVRGGRGGIHRLGNCSDAPAVSLHIYGVQGAQLATHVNDLVRVADSTIMA